jgi:hypothetical protein
MTGIGELDGPCGRVGLQVGPDGAEGARGAVLRGLEVADEIVVLEWGGRKEDEVQRRAHKGQAPQWPLIQPACHENDDTRNSD